MSVQIFNVEGWSFTQNDQKALAKLQHLKKEAQKQLPPSYKSQLIVCLFQEMSKTKLFKALKTIPKGVIHHIHFDCTQDQQFYAKHIITDPTVYLSKQLNSFQVGTKSQANQQGWVSMNQAKSKFANQKEFIKHVSNLTMLSQKQISQNFSQRLTLDQCWAKFEKKISNFFPLLGAVHIFKKYTIHILRKYIKNGYDRMEFRSLLTKLNEYNQVTGELIQTHDETKFMKIFDEAFQIVKKEHPIFSVGFIFFGLKFLPKEQNQKLLTTVLEKKWPKTIGIDFVQQQDPNGSQQPYDDVANKVLAKFPEDDIKKVYHSGETKDHLNKNVLISINAGSVRIGHGINIVQHPELIEVCKQKKVCFEKSPISNLVLSYVTDPRGATAQLLLGLGIPITINPDDPGKFGLEDTTMDYLVTLISSNWDLRHLKLIALHSINHAITSNEHKQELLLSFNKRWNEWVQHFNSS